MADTFDNLQVRLINPENYRDDIMRLLMEVFREEIDAEEFSWKYERIPYGPMCVWGVWDLDSQKMIAAFSAYKRFFIHNSKIITAYQQADAAVHKDYRGKGIFSLLINEITAHARKEGALFHFGYTNDLSSKVMRKHEDARELYVSDVFVFLNGSRDFAQTYLRLRGLLCNTVSRLGTPVIRAYNYFKGFLKAPMNCYLEPLHSFEDYPEEWSFNLARSHCVFPFRDKAFLQWRAIDVPKKLAMDLLPFWCVENGRKIGYCVLYRDKKRNIIKLIDLLSDEGEDLRKCVSMVRYYAVQNNYDAITTNVASRIYQDAFQREGYLKVKKVRATVFLLDKVNFSDCGFDDSFWMQFPIDRDNFRY